MKPLLSVTILAAVMAAGGARAAETPAPLSDYLLQPGDVVRVQIFQEPDLDREVRVSQEGEIFLPLIGRIAVKGVTLNRVEQTVRQLYDRDYLVNPQVNMMVLKYQVRTVNVIGAVNAPQAVEYPPEQTLTILDAISRAGGFNRFADRKNVRLTRTDSAGRTENFTINTDELISGNKSDRWVLLMNDVIFVPERIL
jgi:polysaccharide biosynthesis/export protein